MSDPLGKPSAAPVRRLALTPGEPAGIGPDLIAMLAQQACSDELVVISDPDLLQSRADQLGLPLSLRPFDGGAEPQPDPQGQICVHPVPLSQPVTAGVLNPRNAPHVLATLDAAIDGCLAGRFEAMITAPLHKGVINDAGIRFTGHTEYLADRTGSTPVMMLVADTLRVALATTHLPLRAVADALTVDGLQIVISTLHHDLQTLFGINQPHILVAGLNPHAGESGHLGHEEIDIIEPVLENLRKTGMRLTGPLPADTLFTPHHLVGADAVLAMFHDQGLPVLKFAGFGRGVNVTLGLPLIRTSVDHGTALDKAGTGDIESGSLQAALTLARQLAASRRSPQ